MPWNTKGVKTDPVAGTVLANSGSHNTGPDKYTVVVWNDQEGGQLEIVIREKKSGHNDDDDDDNCIDVITQRLTFPTGGTVVWEMPVSLRPRQRVIIRLREDFFGEVQASILS